MSCGCRKSFGTVYRLEKLMHVYSDNLELIGGIEGKLIGSLYRVQTVRIRIEKEDVIQNQE